MLNIVKHLAWCSNSIVREYCTTRDILLRSALLKEQAYSNVTRAVTAASPAGCTVST
jgi:hypothetical protein